MRCPRLNDACNDQAAVQPGFNTYGAAPAAHWSRGGATHLAHWAAVPVLGSAQDLCHSRLDRVTELHSYVWFVPCGANEPLPLCAVWPYPAAVHIMDGDVCCLVT